MTSTSVDSLVIGGDALTADGVLPLTQSIPMAARAIHEAKSIVMACHVNPDGDALGSMLGLALALRPLGKDLTVISADGIPEIYRFMPGLDLVQTTSDRDTFDLAVVLDSGDLARVGKQIVPIVQRASKMIDIDHHASGVFGDIHVLATSSASTSEIVYDLLVHMDLPITPEIATCLFTGVITDTGSFRFQNVTPPTFRIAADLIEYGAPPSHISENVFDNRSLAATQLLGAALSNIRYTPDEKIIWAVVKNEDFVRFGATDQDTEGIVNFVRGVRGADVGILFREVADGSVRISLRSREHVNVAEIAKQFGGGGHKMASGCSMPPPLADAEKAVVDAVVKWIEEHQE